MIHHERDYLIDYFGICTLKKAYLLKSNGQYIERPQHLFMRVALGIHGLDEEPNFAKIKRTYDGLSLQKFMHATPTLFHAGTTRPQMASCFTENMEVCTSKGVKKINQVIIGDYVVSHTGKTQKVTQIHTNNLNGRKLVNVSFYKGKNLEVTENHKFWAMYDKTDKPKWYRIDQLDTNSFIGIPNKQDTEFDLKCIDLAEYNEEFVKSCDYNTNIKEESIEIQTIYQHTNFGYPVTINKSHTNINRFWNLDNDFYFMSGCFLGDGHIMTSNKKGYRYTVGIGFTFNTQDKELIEKIRDISINLFGIEPTEHQMKNQNTFQILINSHYIGYVFEKLFGKNFNNKKLPDFVYSANKEKVNHLVAGLISTDGCISKQRIVTLQLSNYSLMSQIYHLSRNNNIDVSFTINKYKPKLATVKPVSIRFPSNYDYMKFVIKTYTDDRLKQCLTYTHNTKNQYHPIEINGNKFLKIKSISEIEPKSQLVYTIGVDNDHSYNIEGVLCENCFLIGTEDSVEGIYGTITDCAKISKWAGGIGVHIHDIRSEGSYIRKTGGRSDGIMPMLKVYDSTARYINQSGKRNGSFAMYLEPWHADIIKFLHAKRAQGVEEERARDLFYALWIPDLFMERVQKDEMWSLMCPDECKGLSDCYGNEFVALYENYEKEEKYKSQISARKLWENIVTCQIESGVPYMCYKDAANTKSNQSNIGVIKSSNLCAEIFQYSDAQNPSVCNLASINLKAMLKNPSNILINITIISKPNCFYCKLLKYFLSSRGIRYLELNKEDPTLNTEILELQEKYGDTNYKTVPQVFGELGDSTFNFLGGFWDVWEHLRPNIDYKQLKDVAQDLTYNLNKVIDRNFYPLEGAKKTNFEHRPIGIGIQGLADMFAEMLIPFDSDLAKIINKEIFETIYYGAMKASIELAEKDGPYSSFEGSPLSKGQFQFNLWGLKDNELSGIWDWGELRHQLLKHGARNSLLTALMPTASTAQILGNNECFEPFTSNIYTRSTIAGEFTMINSCLMKLLENIGIWNKDFENLLIYNRGSIQNIKELPQDFKNVFKTVWEISQKKYIELSAERGPFICQSQSLNIWFAKPSFTSLYKAHMLGWSLGLKTGSYYVRQLPAINAQRLGMSASVEKSLQEDTCESCSA